MYDDEDFESLAALLIGFALIAGVIFEKAIHWAFPIIIGIIFISFGCGIQSCIYHINKKKRKE